jgi:DNA-binding SARP family transcriptional activator
MDLSGTSPQIGLLGPLELRVGGESVVIARAKQRALLALLATAAGRTVSVDRMVDELWGDEPPAKAGASLQAYVSNLRKLLEPDRAPGAPATVLVTEPPGYRLVVEPGNLDVSRFETLADKGRTALSDGSAAEALDATTEALALWRGAALEEFRDERFAVATVARLEDLRCACEDDRLTAMVELGLLTTAAAELEAAVRAEPLREARWALLMRTLYATGRHADALDRFQQLRRLLGEELGLEPSPSLVDLERRILGHDPGLAVPPPGAFPSRAHTSTADLEPADPVPAGVSAPTPVPAAAPTGPKAAGGLPLVERDRELVLLAQALADVRSGHPRFVVVEGEAGMGKSALLRELARRCAVDGVVVGLGTCHDNDGAPNLWPWKQALSALDVDVTAPTDTDAFGRLAALAAGLATRSGSGPVACIIEDLHWADPETLRMLSFLAVELRDAAVLVVVSVRSDEARAELDPVVGGVLRHPGAERLALRPLSKEGTESLARAAGDDRLASTEGLHDRTGGNPLFVTELARLLAAEGQTAGLPPGIREVIARRLDRLPEDARALLVLAAVAGDEHDLRFLSQAAGLDIDRVADVLDAAVAAGVLSVAPTSARVSFSHALVRDTVLEPVGDLQRRRLHARLALMWAGVTDDRRAPLERARHSFHAVPLVLPADAVRAAIDAASAAERSADHGTAAYWWERALELLDASDGEAETHPTRGDVLLGLAAAHHRNGADDSAQEAITEALDHAADRGDQALATAAATALGDTGGVWMWTRPDMDPGPLLARVERVAAALDPSDRFGRSLVLGTLALGYTGADPARVESMSTESLELARATSDPRLVARALSVRWRALWRPGGSREQLAVGRELDELARELDDDDLRLSAAVCLHVASLDLGDVAVATAQLDRVLDMARARHRPFVEAQLLPQVATLAALRGDLAGAEAVIETLHRQWARIEFSGSAGDHLRAICLWPVRREQGRLEELAPDLEAQLGAPPISDRRWLAIALAATGRLDEARAALVGDDLGRVDPWYAGGAYAFLDAELAADLGMEALAEVAVAELVPHQDEVVSMGTAGCFGPLALPLGRVAELSGEDDLAERAYRRALALAGAGGLHLPATWARIRLARLLERTGGDASEAAALLAEAFDTADRLNLPSARAAAIGGAPALAG